MDQEHGALRPCSFFQPEDKHHYSVAISIQPSNDKGKPGKHTCFCQQYVLLLLTFSESDPIVQKDKRCLQLTPV